MEPDQRPQFNQQTDFEYADEDAGKKQRSALLKSVGGAVTAALVLGGIMFGLWSYHTDTTGQLQSRIDQLDQALLEAPGAEVIPSGFVEYSNEEAGFAFYYPERWGAVREIGNDNLGSDYFYATFDALPAGRGPRGGGNTIAFGAPSHDTTLADRGRIHTDLPGFMRANRRYVHVRSIFADNQTANINFVDNQITIPLKSRNTTGILVEESDSDYYGYSYLEGRFNLLSDNYDGVNFVTSDPSYRDEFIQMLRTFRTL